MSEVEPIYRLSGSLKVNEKNTTDVYMYMYIITVHNSFHFSK